jgi:hypothetical protein
MHKMYENAEALFLVALLLSYVAQITKKQCFTFP